MSLIGPKCQNCGKQKHHHRASNSACPIGKCHRSLGFSQFHEAQFFEAKKPKHKAASEKRKDRVVRRAVKSNPCCACGTLGSDWNPVDPAHIRTFKVTQSDHPANIIPLCRECHRQQHAEGWGWFLSAYPKVAIHLERTGWAIHQDPFQFSRLIMKHPEIE